MVVNPLEGLINGLLQGHQIATQIHRQEQDDQAFKTNQALHEQQMSMQDIMNRQMLTENARLVSPAGTIDNPAVQGGASPLAGIIPSLGNDPGMPAYVRKADSSRTVKYGGQQFELKTPEEQQQARLNQQISGQNALSDASSAQQARLAQQAETNTMKLEGGPTVASGFTSLGIPDGTPMTRSKFLAAKDELLKQQSAQAGITDKTVSARKTGLEADELQRKLDTLKNADPNDGLRLLDEIVPLSDPANRPLNMRAKAQYSAAIRRGDLTGAQDVIKQVAGEVRQLEVATDPRVKANKISIAVQSADAKTGAMGLTDDDFRREGERYAITGVMPAMGMGSNGRGKIMHYANEFARESGLSPKDLAVSQAAFAGDKASLVKFQAQRDQIVSFEQTAQKNLDLFLNAAAKIPDTGSPWLNLPLRQLNEKLVGSANMAAVNAARQIANNEIAKVTSGGGLGGVLSDSARHEVEAYNPKDATLKQTVAVAKVLKQDMANRHQSMDATLGEIKARIGGTQQPTSYAQTATGKDGHKIGTNDSGKTWFDVQSGQKVN